MELEGGEEEIRIFSYSPFLSLRDMAIGFENNWASVSGNPLHDSY
jgi:hypothetical protein